MAKANATKLVIVESPAKAKTIHKYLGKGYVVRASMGHVRDLPSRGMGVDLESFQPQYDVLPSRAAREARILELLDHVGLPVGAQWRYPHEFSGG